MIETQVKFPSSARKYYQCKNSRVPHLSAIAYKYFIVSSVVVSQFFTFPVLL